MEWDLITIIAFAALCVFVAGFWAGTEYGYKRGKIDATLDDNLKSWPT